MRWLILGTAALAGASWDGPPVRAQESATERIFADALRYENGKEPDYGRALESYCRLAKLGDGSAVYRIGWMYLVGRGVAQNSGTAGQWFLLAASLGSQHATNLVIRLGVSGTAQSVSCSHAAPTAAIRAPKDIEAKVNEMAPQFNLDPKLVLAVIQVESGFRPDAVSPKGARGLMQLLPATAKRFDVGAIENVDDNLKGGMRYLQWLLVRFEGSVKLALAAYNAGEERIVAFHGVPPFPETVEYVERVRALYPSARHRIH